MDYCEPAIGKYIENIIHQARREEQETASGNILTGNTVSKAASWSRVRTKLLRCFKEEDMEQKRNTVTYVRSLSADRHFRQKAADMEGYISTYKQISDILVADRRLTVFDQMMCFLQGLPDSIATRIFEDMRLDVDEPASFNTQGGFSKAMTIALTRTMKKANVSKMYELEMLTGEKKEVGEGQIPFLKQPAENGRQGSQWSAENRLGPARPVQSPV